MENLVNIPVETVVNISTQLWDILGIPGCLGILATWVTQRVKLDPRIPFIEKGNTWIVRGFVVIVGVIFQLVFMFVAKKTITWDIVQQIALTYFAASTAYTHLFKTK